MGLMRDVPERTPSRISWMWSSWVFAAASSPGRARTRCASAAMDLHWVSLSGKMPVSRLNVVVCAIRSSVNPKRLDWR
jgi:hypothetical protein